MLWVKRTYGMFLTSCNHLTRPVYVSRYNHLWKWADTENLGKMLHHFRKSTQRLPYFCSFLLCEKRKIFVQVGNCLEATIKYMVCHWKTNIPKADYETKFSFHLHRVRLCIYVLYLYEWVSECVPMKCKRRF